MREIPSVYNPKNVEGKWYDFWEGKKFFHAEPDPERKPYTIVIPPPNVTGILHMGHALNNTAQDILIRWKRMQGYCTEWLPGTDHAGIATQNVVEKELSKEGIKRHDLGREAFLERVWRWREQYGSRIISQLKKLGASCDWPRIRFTMDDEYSRAVREVFVILWNKGLIYQDDKVINWCPRCKTALSDEEAPHKEINGFLYYIKYPIKKIQNKSQNYIVVATTRPETMLGDTAVAVNPKDRRYKNLIGKTLILPLLNREIKIIADNTVDMKFGTGLVKVTPAHDPNDYVLGKKHNLDFINVMYPNGRMNENAGDYKDMDRFEAREVILEDLKEKGLLESVKPHRLSAGHCYRCHTIIEPYLSRQWFVKMRPLAKPAIEAVKKGRIKFYPKRWTKVYLNWMENIQDWCISRQIWWGHRIPLWYCLDCKKEAFASAEDPKRCRACNSQNLKQDEDVLDTWFSSWLWPFATFGWPEETGDLKYFYPTSSLVTAQEIIFFWVARMIMAGLEFMKDVPFREIYIHGTVRDATGTKMSKSLGNIIDPVDIIEEYGTDALRFSLISITAAGQDVFLSKDKFELGRNFANKIWNASRFVLMNSREDLKYDFNFKEANLTLADKWVLSRLNRTIESVTKALENYRLNEAANTIYEFFWHEFCDWYVELVKPEMTKEEFKDTPRKMTAQSILVYCLDNSLRLLHPFMPFVTEEIWQNLPHDGESLTVASWPRRKGTINKKVEEEFSLAIGIITSIRNIRAEANVPPQKLCKVIISTANIKNREAINNCSGYIRSLAKVESIELGKRVQRPRASSFTVFRDCGIYIPLEGLINLEAEKKKLKREIEKLEQRLDSIESKLKNKDFIKKAPKEVIMRERDKRQETHIAIYKLKENLKRLGT